LNGFVDANAKKPITRKAHYAQLKKSGIIKLDYELPAFPEKLNYIYQWYADLTWLGVGVVELKAYFELKKITPTPSEFETLIELIKINRGSK